MFNIPSHKWNVFQNYRKILTEVRLPMVKKKKTPTNVGNNAGKKTSYTVGGNVNCYNHN
jgi:hypothetical protein